MEFEEILNRKIEYYWNTEFAHYSARSEFQNNLTK